MVALSHPAGGVTAGLDIGTTSVKAVAVDGDGRVLARARVPHRLRVPSPGCLEHDAASAWLDGPRAALGAVASAATSSGGLAAVAVSALTPSIAAVDAAGVPVGCGVLYDDERSGVAEGADPTASDEATGLLAWAVATHPGAAGYWPAQAVANRGLGGPGVVDYSSASSSGRLFDGSGWNQAVCASVGARGSTLPEVRIFGEVVGAVDRRWCSPGRDGPLLVAGGVDAFCEQLVAGADGPGDVLVVCGSTLVVWVNADGWPTLPGLWTLPHLRTGGAVVGGPSNAGGLFLDWVDRLVAPATGPADAAAVPVWWPYVRGERVPLHDRARRAALGGIDLTAGPAEVRRAAREASAFAVRHILDAVGADPARVVLTGGGIRDGGWVQALADGLGRPVQPVAVPEGAALGAAWLARMGAGLESSIEGAQRWARPGRPVTPDPDWVGPTAARYLRYRDGIGECGGLHVH